MARGIINSWDLAQATGMDYALGVTGRGQPGWRYAGIEYHEGGWDAMVAATGITEWVRVGGSSALGDWWPATIVDRIKALGLRRDNGGRLTITPGRPCDENISGDWTHHRCTRPAVDTWEQGGIAGQTVHLCALHLGAARKRRESTERITREVRESMERSRRNRDHLDLAAEFLEWAGPLLAEVGIHPKTVTPGVVQDRAGILLPTEAVATLVELATGERYPGSPHHQEHTP